ncbi:uncharacterized protein NECHADRAFT_85166 [Fusarium vanettenii 77-13-4]|uniref:Clr5 domain-containing protein n=1 Tax=Fusarium vanettenii (strain ATCC MYA-4622 / CBS 123669 / FGSC 9596 / NRRL 45880 / 77-13-4) TaxID=660122 RepID=C7YV64_FUSV7|nr:uncharacterized protein NECHADRAFT_85166 [Fusarium vanettenii 77-13-4]EEU44931.1 predicted protein [Fusarium vanettenii 77-13-4]
METNEREVLDWDKHTDEIRDLFISQNLTLAQVISHMEETHNFKATYYPLFNPSRQIIKLQANNTTMAERDTDEWIWIDQEIQRRAAVGKKSEPCLLGRRLPADRVRRETARHRRRRHATMPPNPSKAISSEGIRQESISPNDICPESTSTKGVRPSSISTNDIRPESNIDGGKYARKSHGPQAPIQASPQEALFDMQFELDQILQPDTMDIDAVTYDPFSLDSLEMWDLELASDLNQPTPCRQPPVTTVGDPSSPGTSSSLRPQYPGTRFSPVSQFFNFEIFDTRPSFQLMTDLPWFKLQTTLEQLGAIASKTFNSFSKLTPEENVSVVTNKLQRSIPERWEGDLSNKITHILDSRSTSTSSLSAIFSLAAYFASNNKLEDTRMDTFLKWVMDQKYTEHLERFLQINTPTIHAFASHVLKSAVRVKNVKFLTALTDLGVKFDSILDKILQIGDMDFMKLAFSRVSPPFCNGQKGTELFHLCVEGGHFDLARMLATKGANADKEISRKTPLYSAVERKDLHAVTFLLELGADVNKACSPYGMDYEAPLARAVLWKELDIVAVLLKHDADTSCKVGKQDIVQWSSLNCRNICRLLQEHIGGIDVGFTVGDLVDAANEGNDSLNAYLQRQPRTVSKQQLEEALNESVRLGYIPASNALLKYGVDPNCPCLDSPPLRTALLSHKWPRRICKLLIKYKADVNRGFILENAVRKDDFKLLQIIIEAGMNLEEEGEEALVEAAVRGHTSLAALLLHLGVDANTPGLTRNPLQAAAREGELKMLEFLLDHGADINAPAYLNGGRTALQAALEGETPENAWLLLDRGADISGPPALVDGVTALEAVCHNWMALDSSDHLAGLCDYLLDCNAPVNRPNGKPSSALHGAIERRWDGILARMLEPHRNAIINHMWCDQSMEEEDFYMWEPRTPTQLAAEKGQLETVKMLVGRGADPNEAPAYRFGRTALQAATSRDEPDMDLVQFLLDNGADVNAKPAVHGGITALQGSAISGDIMLAKQLIDKGADVNGAPSFVEGRYAIEGAAEHGRLDMVQFLLNAGARGNVLNGTGFKYAIELATENEHFAIANLLKNVPTAEA